MGLLDFVSGLVGGSGESGATDDRPDGGTAGASGGDAGAGGGGTDATGGDTDDGTAVEDMTPADFREHAEEFAAEHGEDYDLDFSVASLAAVDEFASGQGDVLRALGEESEDVGGLAEQMHGLYTIETGSYLGEVLRREHGGRWEYDGGWAVVLEDGGDGTPVSVFDAAARSFADEPVFHSLAAEVGDAIEAGGASAGAGQGVDDTEDGSSQEGGDSEDSRPDDETEGAVVAVEAEEPVDDRRASLIEEAEELVEFWPEHELDFTPASLARLDAFVDDQWENERFRDASLSTDGDPDHMDDAVYTGLVTQLGAYYGEVLVRNYDAEWADSEEMGRTVVTVRADESAAENDGAGAGDADADSLDSNVFHIAEDCLTEPSKFAVSHDTVVDVLGLDAPQVSDGSGTAVAMAAGEGDADGDKAERGHGDASGGADDPAVRDDEFTEADGEEFVAELADSAETIAGEWPRYRLDFSPNSLVRLDVLVREEFADLDFEGVELGDESDGDSLFLTAHAMEAGGYLARVMTDHCGADWEVTDQGVELVVPGREAEARFDPIGVAAACFRGEDSFAATYEAIRGELDVDAPAIDDDAAVEAIGSGLLTLAADSPWDLASTAESLAEAREADLDFSPESLVHLDELVGDRETAVVSDGDDSYAVVAADPDDPDPAAAAGAYLGEVFVRSYGAEWTAVDDAGWVVEVTDYEGSDEDEETAVVAVPAVLRDCIAGEASFATVHDAAVEDLGLSGPTLTDGGTDRTE